MIKPLFLFVMLSISSMSVQAQTGRRQSGPSPISKFPNVDTGRKVILTSYDPILSAPKVVCMEQGAEVTSFSISFQLIGKDRYFGPYETKGSKLADAQISLLKQFKAEKIEKVRVFVEEIHTKYNGEDRITNPIIVTITPR